MDLGFFHRHPYLTGGVVLVSGVLFFVIVRGGGSGGAIAYQSGPSAAQTQADAAFRIAQLQQGVQTHAIDMQLEQARVASETAIELATIQANTKGTEVAAQQALGLAAIDSQNQVTAAQLEAFKKQTESAVALSMQQMANDAAHQHQVDRTNYDVQAWNFYNTQTFMRLSDDAQERQSARDYALNNRLVDLLQTQRTA